VRHAPILRKIVRRTTAWAAPRTLHCYGAGFFSASL
jgi:hypothetical protein